MARDRAIRPRPSDSTYLELVRSLFSTLAPSVLMSALLIGTAVAAIHTDPHPWIVATAGIATVVALLRLALLFSLQRRVDHESFDLAAARRTELTFGITQISFAAALGAFAAACFLICEPAHHMIIVALIVGYAAGVAAGFSLRLWIGVPAILLAVTPTIMTSVYLADNAHLLLAGILLVMMVGGIGSMVLRYQAAVETTELRQMFASLARRDRLTGLANRLGLEERFAHGIKDGEVILHCIDLDRFKPVNDIHGHMVGDLLLKAVASRLERLIRSQDLAVRLGGDEFAILQVGVQHPNEGELMARRIERAIAAPYVVRNCDIEIGASIGSASSEEHGDELDDLLEVADQALYGMKAKRRGGAKLAV
ncbi:GGDEF domain-containing protein [Sphingomonas sabuli]|uniref:GGDEF domain-containing protein n=1 Tax=Sphingomonas sabuli TaxID=2764186 RepID=A0A7G9KZX6_9SPHN|nr:GGDEF domain-containing protein [Sphingomonas sabuli]QNM81925.1 GGDEF domain-containing protein [Sphingomonas sabuli]